MRKTGNGKVGAQRVKQLSDYTAGGRSVRIPTVGQHGDDAAGGEGLECQEERW